MAELDLSEIPNDVMRKALRETIEEKLKSKNYTVAISSASKAGENNFVGVIYRVSFSKVGEEGQNKLIFKVAPQNEVRRSQFVSRICFLREIYMYNEVNSLSSID